MCGLFGMIGNVENSVELCRNLSVFTIPRGEDSVGLCAIRDNEFYLWKRDIHPRFAINDMAFAKTAHGDVIIGHNRFATHGKVNRKNAHPFKKRNIIWAHNGTLESLTGLDIRFGIKHEVDSRYLGEAYLQEMGHIENFSGTAAVTLYDRHKPNEVQIYVNGRTLFLAYVGNKNSLHPTGIVWASEESILENSLSLAQIETYDVYEVAQKSRLILSYNKKKQIVTDQWYDWEGVKKPIYKPYSGIPYKSKFMKTRNVLKTKPIVCDDEWNAYCKSTESDIPKLSDRKSVHSLTDEEFTQSDHIDVIEDNILDNLDEM